MSTFIEIREASEAALLGLALMPMNPHTYTDAEIMAASGLNLEEDTIDDPIMQTLRELRTGEFDGWSLTKLVQSGSEPSLSPSSWYLQGWESKRNQMLAREQAHAIQIASFGKRISPT